MSKFNPFTRRKEPPISTPLPPTAEEQRKQRQENARRFFEGVRQEPEAAPPPADLPLAQGGALLAPPPTPQLPAALDVAQELERARANGLFGGTVRQVQKEAAAEEQVGRAVQSKLQTRADIVGKSEELLKAQNSLKNTLYDGQIQEENKATELSRARLARLQAERDLLAKMSGGAVPTPSAEPAPPPSARITDEQIEAMALRIVMQLKREDDPEQAWETQRAELYRTLPVNIAREVEGKVREKHDTLA